MQRRSDAADSRPDSQRIIGVLGSLVAHRCHDDDARGHGSGHRPSKVDGIIVKVTGDRDDVGAVVDRLLDEERRVVLCFTRPAGQRAVRRITMKGECIGVERRVRRHTKLGRDQDLRDRGAMRHILGG